MSEDSNTTTNAILIETYEMISTKVFEEERRLRNLKNVNYLLIPQGAKKSTCSLPNNHNALIFFQKKTTNQSLTFEKYIHERRENETSTQSVLQQSSQLVSYLKMTLKIDQMETRELLNEVVVNHPLMINGYFHFLRESGLKCSTILSRINSTLHLIQWLRLTTTENFHHLGEILDRLMIDRSRYNSIASIDQKKKTLDNLVDMRQWVEGGLPALQSLMLDSWPYFDSLVSLTKYQNLRSHQYSWALGFTLATLWVYGVNARAQSVESMTLKNFREIEQNNFYLASQFKTSSTYGYQIISPTDVLRIYVKYIRAQIISPDIDSDESCLFPSFAKTPLGRGEASKKIGLIFQIYGYDLSVTKLRDMLATHIEELFRGGKISETGQ